MKFGVFDHMDDAGVPHGELFAGRLKLAEIYDRAGFHAYHLAEHHGTPIGCAASPGLFLAALSQRTTRLRFGPMVYLLPFYHPLRLIEEICMLDVMSGGRLELGIGRGVSPFETANYALDFAQTQAMYHEAFQVLLAGLHSDELSFAGKFYRFDNVRMVLRPVQRPHPPLWYGVSVPDNADWPAQNDVNVISLAPPQMVRPIFDRYCAMRGKLNKEDTTLYGVGRHVVVADTDAEALAIARRAYPRWRGNFFWLFKQRGSAPRVGELYPQEFDAVAALGTAVAGAPSTVREFIAADVKATGANYWTPWLAFGGMTPGEALHSVELFAREVMPAFA
jgi:alkanesulfonate monooxygenase SsuD/methylene tetrahydromethanopterin reductase-like flavin-dependent oxidoreductase (luciferase family)